MNDIKLNMENLSAEERETLTRLIEKANTNAPQSKVWQPSKGEEYWYIFQDGGVDHSRLYDEDTFNFQQVFKTEEEAEERSNQLKYKWQFERLAIESGELENPWDAAQKHWFVGFDLILNEVTYDCCHTVLITQHTYFPSKEAAKKSSTDYWNT